MKAKAGDVGNDLGEPVDEVVVGRQGDATPRTGFVTITRVEDGGPQGASGGLPTAQDRIAVAEVVALGF